MGRAGPDLFPARGTGETVDQIYARVAELMALKRIVADEEVARAALFLASDYASAITGAALDANAGNFIPMGGLAAAVAVGDWSEGHRSASSQRQMASARSN